MKEIQAVNAVRKHAVSEGMSLEEAMEKWKTIRGRAGRIQMTTYVIKRTD